MHRRPRAAWSGGVRVGLDVVACVTIGAAAVCLAGAVLGAALGALEARLEWAMLMAFRACLIAAVGLLLLARVIDLARLLRPAPVRSRPAPPAAVEPAEGCGGR